MDLEMARQIDWSIEQVDHKLFFFNENHVFKFRPFIHDDSEIAITLRFH